MDDSLLGEWHSRLYERYAAVAARRLETDAEFQRARAEWEQFFVDSLYVDFVVDRLIRAAEREFGFTLVNREATHNTDALSVRFGDLHDRIVDSDEFGPTGDDGFDLLPLEAAGLLNADTAFLRSLYEAIIPRELRLALGEYYTPRGVAELAVADPPVDRPDSASFLDPGCGSGVFLAVCIERKIESLSDRLSPRELVDAITFQGEGLELTVDHLVGNPPWLTWGALPEPLKDAWRETYIDRLDLFPHEGFASRLGHGNDDISVLFVWVCTSHYLAEGGTASFVLKRDILRGPAGKLLRTQSVGGRRLAVRHVHDFSDLRPFGPDVGADAAIYTFSADAELTFPVPLDSWTGGLVPVDAEDPSSAWVRDAADRAALEDRASTWLEGGPFYNVFGLGEYTWSPYKIVWCRLGFKPDFAVVSTVDDAELGEKQVVPGNHYMFMPTGSKAEAHFLCGLLNSAVYQRSLGELASNGKSSLSKAVVSQLALPAYQDTEASRRLAELSMRAHDVVAANTDGALFSGSR